MNLEVRFLSVGCFKPVYIVMRMYLKRQYKQPRFERCILLLSHVDWAC